MALADRLGVELGPLAEAVLVEERLERAPDEQRRALVGLGLLECVDDVVTGAQSMPS